MLQSMKESSCTFAQLLDTLVKNCGYPMHLQIATKDFLNELVRRFPERPPAFPPPPMNKILELIHEWKNTICMSSKYREDLTNIRDMHRLLGYKGGQHDLCCLDIELMTVDPQATGFETSTSVRHPC